MLLRTTKIKHQLFTEYFLFLSNRITLKWIIFKHTKFLNYFIRNEVI